MQNQSSYEEKTLLQQVAKGSETAFKILFLQYGPMLKNYLLKLSRSKETAEDILHDVFLEVWKNREGLVEIEHFKSYLFRAVHNRAHRSFERQAKITLIVHELSIQQDPGARFEGEDRITSAEVKRFIQQAIDKLTPRQKEIFLLSRNEGLKHDEIAERLGISTQTVTNHISDALRLLRAEIGGSYGSYAIVICILHGFL